MRIIDADSLMDDIKRDSKKAIDEGDKVGSFWLGYAAGLVIKQPTIQPEKAQLSQQDTTSDLISRQAAIDALQKCRKHCIDPFDSYHIDIQDAENQLSKLPSAQPVATDICVGDTISRQALCEYALNQKDKSVSPNDIMRFPSVQPEPQEGHWIKHETPDGGEQYECSRCGVLWEFNDGTPEDNEAYFCPNCGAKMKGVRHESN